jgi:uncharacterized protein (TIGR03382 family)
MMSRTALLACLTLSLTALANPIIIDLSSTDLTGQLLESDGTVGWVKATEGNNEVLFRTDGTVAGTLRLRSFPPVGSTRASVNVFPVSGGMAFVQANNSFELTDGTSAPFIVLGTTAGRLFSAGPEAQGRSFFVMIVDATSPNQLIVSDRTASGTHTVAGVSIDRNSSSPTAVVGAQLYFVSSTGDVGVTDGATTSVFFPKDVNRLARAVYACGDRLFVVSQQSGQTTVHVSAPPLAPVLLTAPGTLSMQDLSCSPAGTFFAGYTTAFGTELWRTDGTDAGTAMVHDVNPGSTSGLPFVRIVPHADGGVHFAGNDGVTGPQVWFTQGVTGAVRVSNGAPPDLLPVAADGWAFYKVGANSFMATSSDVVSLDLAIRTANVSSWKSSPEPVVVGSKLISFGSRNVPFRRDQLWVFDTALPFPIDDGGVVDAGVLDAGLPDAGRFDAGSIDAGLVDAGVPDAGSVDAGTDAGTPDSGVIDAGMTDAGIADAGTTDAGTTDAGAAEQGTPDAGVDQPNPPTGCGCAGAPSLLPMVFALLALRRRRPGTQRT